MVLYEQHATCVPQAASALTRSAKLAAGTVDQLFTRFTRNAQTETEEPARARTGQTRPY